MNGVGNLVEVAQRMARNPLGIIGLFIVLVYGLASVVAILADSLTVTERLPLIYFLVLYPVLVLMAFVWLVRNHSNKLYGPGDFVDEDNFMRLHNAELETAVALGAAKAKTQGLTRDLSVHEIVRAIRVAAPARPGPEERRKASILWVDDRPENNTYERQAFEATGLGITLVLTTDQASAELARNQYAAIISDMARVEGAREGYVLLDGLREGGDRTPLFFYTSTNLPEHQQETYEHNGQGCTNDPQELFEMVVKAVNKR